jgi:hypothetical protein
MPLLSYRTDYKSARAEELGLVINKLFYIF